MSYRKLSCWPLIINWLLLPVIPKQLPLSYLYINNIQQTRNRVNHVLSNNVLSNNVLSNNVLSNYILSTNVLLNNIPFETVLQVHVVGLYIFITGRNDKIISSEEHREYQKKPLCKMTDFLVGPHTRTRALRELMILLKKVIHHHPLYPSSSPPLPLPLLTQLSFLFIRKK